MNSKRRERLTKSKLILEKIANELDSVSDEEMDSLDNVPENLRDSERFAQMEEAADKIGDAKSFVEDAVSILEDVISA